MSKESETDTKKEKKTLSYILKQNGIIQKEYIAAKNMEEIDFVKKGCYMLAIDELFLLLNEDNDKFDVGLANGSNFTTTLSVNKALQTFFPNSKFLGDIIAVKTKDNDSEELSVSDWDINLLKNYILMPNSHCFTPKIEELD